jgi:putative ubiquitin-RnfH superfamily antitoxin RatB of RatAB toxin-antitoxin module
MADLLPTILVEIVYAQPQRATVKALSLPQGARVADALLMAAADARLLQIDLGHATLGIHGQVVTRDQVLSDGDRIEIYRPLVEDPKLARRKRAAPSKSCRS